MSFYEQFDNHFHSPQQQANHEERRVSSIQRRKEYNDLKIVSRFEEEKLKDKIEMLSPQIKKGQKFLENEIIENANENGSPNKLIRMSTQFKIEKSHHNPSSNQVKRAAQSVLLQSEYGISDVDDGHKSYKSPSPRIKKGQSPTVSSLYDTSKLNPTSLKLGGMKIMSGSEKRRLFQMKQNHPKSMMSNRSHRSIRSNVAEQHPKNQNDIIQATHELLFQGLTPNQKILGQRDAQRASFLKPKNPNQQQTSTNLLTYQANNQTEDSSSANLSKSFLTNNKDQTLENMIPSQPSIDKKQRDFSRDTQYINSTNYNGFLNTYTDQTHDIQTPLYNAQRQRQRGDSVLSGFRDPSFIRKQEEMGRKNMRVMITKENVDFAMRVNQHILNLDIEEMNRNTRFFRDYIKDQVKELQGKSSKKLPILRELAGSLFKKQDSLTKNIQKESAAPLRRLTKSGFGNKSTKSTKKNESLVKSKFQQSIRSLFGTKKPKEKERRSSLRRNSRGVSIEDISQKSEQDEENEGNIKKKGSISKTTIGSIHSKNEDEDINEDQIRKINQGRAKSRFLMYPDATIRSLIDGVSFILLLVISVYIPFIISFNVDTSGPFDYFELFIDIWFLMEITANFITGFYHKGILIMDRKMIFITYLQGWFLVDLLSSAPILVISIANQDSSSDFQAVRSTKLIRMLRFARYARLLRLIKFLRLNRYLQPLEELIVTDYAHLSVRFLKISCAVVFITHWAACMMYTVGISEFESEGRNWLQLQDLNDASVSEQYINSLYWASTTMCTVGYGDYHPITSNERVVSMIVMIMSSGVFAFIIGDIGRMVSGFNLLADEFRERMNYVDRFLTQKCIPLNLRLQVKRYLEYNWQLKKIYKIEEQDLLSLLNENLRGKITVYFNGRILQNIDVLCKFPIEFLSNLSFLLRKQTYSIDDNLIVEKGQGAELFYMQNGRVSAIHMKTKTHLTDLEKDRYFGEISFFTSLNRQATIKARDFTEVLIINREDFLQMLLKDSFRASLMLFHKIRDTISENSKDFRILSIRCYICYTLGHIAIHCKQFQRYKGNLKRYYKKIYKQSFQSSTESIDESKHNPIVNTEDSHNKHFKINRQRSRASKRERMTHITPQKKIVSDNQLLTSQIFGSIYNDIVFPVETNPEVLNELNHLEDLDKIDEEFQKLDEDSNRHQLFNQTPSFALNLLTTYGGNTESRQQNNGLRNQGQQQFESGSQGEQIQMIHFDTPPKEEQQITPSQRYAQRKSIKRGRKSQKGIRDVIQEEMYEDDESSIISVISASYSNDESSQFNISIASKSDDQEEEEKTPLLSQSTSQQIPRAPRAINELTKLMGRKKRFKSKNLREEEKLKIRQSVEARRKIHIRPLTEIQKEIKTIVQKTFTTMVETITKEEKYHISPTTRLDSKIKKKNSDYKGAGNMGSGILSGGGNYDEVFKQNSSRQEQRQLSLIPSPIKTSNEDSNKQQKISAMQKQKKPSGSMNNSSHNIIEPKNNNKTRKQGIILTHISQLESSNNSDVKISDNDQNWPTYRKNQKQNSAQSQKYPEQQYTFKQDSTNDNRQSTKQNSNINRNEDLISKQTNYYKQEDKRNQLFINHDNLQVFKDEQSNVVEKWDDMQQVMEEFKKQQQ